MRDESTAILGLSGTFLAVLSTSTASAASRFDLGGPPWVRLDGIQLADSNLAFMSGSLRTSLNLTSAGVYASPNVFTGGSLTTTVGDPLLTCVDWMNPTNSGVVGFSSFTNPQFSTAGNQDCNISSQIYCLEN